MVVYCSVSQVKIDIPSNLKKIKDDKFWKFAAQSWQRLIDKYVPYREGNLSKTVTIKPKEIEYTVPYSLHIYRGEKFNFRKDIHPLAGARWDKRAEPTQKPLLIKEMQAYVDSGKLKLGK